MASKSRKLDNMFLRTAAANPDEALAYQLMRAFGVTLEDATAMCMRAIASKNDKLVLLCLTSGVQVRQNAVFVGPEYGNIRDGFPDLVVSGERVSEDEFNFGALHLMGHVFAVLSNSALGLKIRQKAGCCATGEYKKDTPAGKINAEIFAGHSASAVEAMRTLAGALTADSKSFLLACTDGVSAKAEAFRKAQGGSAMSSTSSRVPPSKPSASEKM